MPKPWTLLFPAEHPLTDRAMKLLLRRGIGFQVDGAGLSVQLANGMTVESARDLVRASLRPRRRAAA